MSRIWTPISIFTVLAGIAFVLGGALADPADILLDQQLDRSAWQWVETDDGYEIFDPQGRPLQATGLPALPVREVLLLIPDDLPLVDVVVEARATHEEAIPGPLALAGPLVASDGSEVPVTVEVEPGAAYPAAWGEFRGVHLYRGFRLAAVAVHPVRVGVDGTTVEVLDEFVVRAVLDPTRAAGPALAREREVSGERRIIENQLRALVANPAELDGYLRQDGVKVDDGGVFLPTPNPSLEGSAVEYVIITNEAMSGEFQRLADFRTAQGLPSVVVTHEWITSHGRRGVDLQETLRFFLQDAYAKWGMRYVVIGGDTDIIPPRWVRSQFYPFGGHTDIPTDIYYSCLDGNWNANGDGWMGQPYYSAINQGDEADFAPEVGVGRVPVSSVVAAADVVDKLIQYESTPASAGYANRFLFAAEVLFPTSWPNDPLQLDGAQYCEQLIAEIIEPCTDMTALAMYENNGPYPHSAHLSRAALIDTLNTGHYGIFDQIGHGHYFVMSVGDANFRSADADALTNPNYFLLYALNCASGAYDFSCLMERFVQNPHGGSVASIGSAREAFPATSNNYQQTFFSVLMCDDTHRAGDAINGSRLPFVANTARNTVDRWTQLNYNLLGDPANGIWTGSPRALTISAPSSIAAGQQNLAVTVMASGSPVENALVCARKGGETYAYGVTNGGGAVSLPIAPASAGNLTITVTGNDLARTTRNVPVTVSGPFLACAELLPHDQNGQGAAIGNGNGVAEAGETVEFTLVVRNNGTINAANVSATVVCDHPGVDFLVSTVAVGSVPAGGFQASLQNVVAHFDPTIVDGERLVLEISMTSSSGGPYASEVLQDVAAPEGEPIAVYWNDAIHGDSDGVIEDGERISVTVALKNFGAGRFDGATGRLRTASPNVTLIDTSTTYAAMGLLGTGAGYPLFSLQLADASLVAASPCTLLVTDGYGREIRHVFSLTAPVAPDIPETDTTLGPDTIALRWTPVADPDLRGYNVYRSTSPSGPFARVNVDILEATSYFQDMGLQQLTTYYYELAALNASLIEGPHSAVISADTAPPELPAYPIGFSVETSSHAAVGDVNGDGDLEIVMASNEVYVWDANGEELFDGDEDAQTNGPLTNLNGQFEPAGVVLANLDGHAGLEMIVSERANKIYVIKADGTVLPGWPQTMNYWNWQTPAVGDIDGDGDLEIVVNNLAGRTYVWHHNGTELRDGDSNPATNGVFLVRSESWGYSSPAVCDLDGDGRQDIIFGTSYYNSSNALLAYRYNGTAVPGFPHALGTNRVICAPAIADLEGNGDLEIVFFDVSHRLHVVRENGAAYPGFPITQGGVPADASAGPSPALGDLDNDGEIEILWPINGGGERCDLVAVDTGLGDGTSGQVMAGWPVQLPGNSEASPVIGDITGDGSVDIVFGIGGGSTESPDNLYAFHADGSPLTGFPINLDGHCRPAATLCDLDRDGNVNIVYGGWDRLMHVWDMPFPYVTDLMPWPTFHGNMYRNGVMGDPLGVGVAVEDVPSAFRVEAPFPNPFNPLTTVRLYVPEGASARLEIAVFDLRGRRVRELHDGELPAGWHDFTWDGRDGGGKTLASGVYVMRAVHAGTAATYKLTLMK